MNKFKDRLIEARHESGMSQKQLAKSIGTGQATIGSIECGRNKEPSLFLNLANALNVNVEWLLGGPAPKRGVSGSKIERPAQEINDPWPFKLISRSEFESLSTQQQFYVERNFADLVKAFSNKVEKQKFPITQNEEDLSSGKPYVHKIGIIEDDVESINQNQPDGDTGTNGRRQQRGRK